MKNFRKLLLICILLDLISSGVIGQVNSVYEKMSLDEILNVDVVVTASKKPEDLFEAPLSVTIIKKDEINRSGVTSIPEALRLSPGLIVREISPGNYDVQIRGYDDVTKNAFLSLPYNTTTLVMIDNRIVYSYFTGGTFWETFPIDINDIERIEVVRGPASALYGPNAVTGVINIITTHANNKGMNISAKGIAGSNQAKNASTNIGYNWNDRTRLSFSGNFTERHRYKTEYFDQSTQSYNSLENQHMYMKSEKDLTTHETWTANDYRKQLGADYEEDVSLRKLGGNIFFYHGFSAQKTMDISIGAQSSQSIKTGFQNFVTPLSQLNSKSWYLNSRFKINDFNGQFDVNSGEDLSNYQFNSYKFTNIDANLEYYKQYNSLSFRPGISFKNSKYNSPLVYNEPFSQTDLNYQFKDEPRMINSYAGSLLTEWKPNPKLRVIGAARIDKFSINKNFSLNLELASTYRLNKNNLVRFVVSKANRSPFIFDTYLNSNFNLSIDYVSKYEQDPLNVPIRLNIYANKDLKFPAIRSHELSWRTKLNSGFSLDLEMFFSNYSNFVVSNVYREADILQHINQNGLEDYIYSIKSTTDFVFENYDLKAHQYGASFTLIYNPSEKIHAKVFGTFQKTGLSGKTKTEFTVTDVNFGEINADNIRKVELYSFTNPTQWSEKLTPTVFGGFYLSYKYNSKWNFNTDSYFASKQTFIDFNSNNTTGDYTGIYTNYSMDIKANMVLNAKASYQVNQNVTVFGTVKNIFGNHREYGYADQIGRLILIGIQWEP